MATTDLTSGSSAFWEATEKIVVNRIDLAGIATADVVQAVDVPAGWMVTCVRTKVVTKPSSSTCICDIGDATDPNGWDDTVDFYVTAGTMTSSSASDAYYVTGKIFTAANTIDLTMTANASPIVSGVVDIMVSMVKLY